MNTERILHVCTHAGKILLESGAETYRVEETIVRICKSFDVDFAESYVTLTGIMVSIYDKDKKTKTLITRIKIRSNNLQKIHLVNDLSREISLKKLSIDEVEQKLYEIEQTKTYPKALGILASGIGAACLTILVGGGPIDATACFFIGLAIRLICLAGDRLLLNGFFVNIIGGAFASIVAITLFNIGVPVEVNYVIIGSIMLLVPGLAITNAIRDTISGDLLSGLTRAAEAFFVAVSIAIGTGSVLSIWVNYLGGSIK